MWSRTPNISALVAPWAALYCECPAKSVPGVHPHDAPVRAGAGRAGPRRTDTAPRSAARSRSGGHRRRSTRRGCRRSCRATGSDRRTTRRASTPGEACSRPAARRAWRAGPTQLLVVVSPTLQAKSPSVLFTRSVCSSRSPMSVPSSSTCGSPKCSIPEGPVDDVQARRGPACGSSCRRFSSKRFFMCSTSSSTGMSSEGVGRGTVKSFFMPGRLGSPRSSSSCRSLIWK